MFPYLSLRLPVRLRCFAGGLCSNLASGGMLLGHQVRVMHGHVGALVEVVLLRFRTVRCVSPCVCGALLVVCVRTLLSVGCCWGMILRGCFQCPV